MTGSFKKLTDNPKLIDADDRIKKLTCVIVAHSI
jgi:hypothetical protein